MTPIADREGSVAQRRRPAIHCDRVAGARAQVVERDAHLPGGRDGGARGAQPLGELAQHAQYLALLLDLVRAQLVTQGDRFRWLDEQRRPGRRFVVHDAANLAARGAPHRDHVAAPAHGDACVGSSLPLVQPRENRFELGDEPLPRLAHRLARPCQVARRAVAHGAVRVERFREARLELLRWEGDAQRRRARRVRRQSPQLSRHEPCRGERASDPSEGQAFEGASGHREQLQSWADVRDRLRADGIIHEDTGSELGHLRESGLDRSGIGSGGAGADPRRSERGYGVRRHPLQRGRKLKCIQHGGGDPSPHAHTVAASSSRAI